MVSFTRGPNNPFSLSNVGEYSAPTFTDIDGDRDLDAFVITWYKNQGGGTFR